MNFACMNSSHNIAVNLEGNISFGTMNLFANNFNITVFGTLTVDEKYTTNKIEMIIDEDNFCELLLRTRNNNWIEIKTKTEKKGYVLWKTFKMNQKFPTIFSETYVSNGDILGEEPELTALAMRCYSRGDALFFVSVISNTVDPVPITLQIDREGFKLSSKTESPVCVPWNNGCMEFYSPKKQKNILKISIENVDSGNAIFLVSNLQRNLIHLTLLIFYQMNLSNIQRNFPQSLAVVDCSEFAEKQLPVKSGVSNSKLALYSDVIMNYDTRKKKIFQRHDTFQSSLLSPLFSFDSPLHDSMSANRKFVLDKCILTPTIYLYIPYYNDSENNNLKNQDIIWSDYFYILDNIQNKIAVANIRVFENHFVVEFPHFQISRSFSQFSQAEISQVHPLRCILNLDEIEFITIEFVSKKLALNFAGNFNKTCGEYLSRKNKNKSFKYKCFIYTSIGKIPANINLENSCFKIDSMIDKFSSKYKSSQVIANHPNFSGIKIILLDHKNTIQIEFPSNQIADSFASVFDHLRTKYLTHSISKHLSIFTIFVEELPLSQILKKSQLFLTEDCLTLWNENNTLQSYRLSECIIFDQKENQCKLQLGHSFFILAMFTNSTIKASFVSLANELKIGQYFPKDSWHFRVKLALSSSNFIDGTLSFDQDKIILVFGTDKFSNNVLEHRIHNFLLFENEKANPI
eukprot:Anaeramoba_ignava/a483935_18.p1 GENE.a483935_18~~a483935_18.p1  ORF type:complete len:688 (-),score=183.63 a483935_18:152-2215(-)